MGSEDEGTAMIAVTCRRCGATDLRRNGRRLAGQQKFHCKGCNLYGTLVTKAIEREQKRELIAQLNLERLSQRAIARTARAARATVAKILKKSPSGLS
jgi:transposase-like protein